ncbi:MAG: 2-phosphosulfolactate phosphatase [Ignavibacteria bacterium]|nr:2-phosphosulfolactate phosphatase [Ignavibacteria bacterium]
MINITAYLTHSLIADELTLKGKNVIVIDALRATSTIATALVNGAKEVIPTENAATAVRVAKGSGNSMLCGERGGKIIEGFNLGNSPLEYTAEAIKDKSLVFSTTNGTVSLSKAKYAKNCLLASFLNIQAVVDFVKELNEDIVIICSGKLNNFCIEDAVCAGVIINKLIDKNEENYSFTDSENACIKLAKAYAYEKSKISPHKILDMMKISEHGKYLVEIGFQNDLEFCSAVDSIHSIPMLKSGIIKLKEKFEGESMQKMQMKKLSLTTDKEEVSAKDVA